MMVLQRHIDIEWTTIFEKIDMETKTMVNWKKGSSFKRSMAIVGGIHLESQV